MAYTYRDNRQTVTRLTNWCRRIDFFWPDPEEANCQHAATVLRRIGTYCPDDALQLAVLKLAHDIVRGRVTRTEACERVQELAVAAQRRRQHKKPPKG